MKLRMLTILICLLIVAWSGSAMAWQFTDHSDRKHHIDRPMIRIISLYGAHTENLFSLGLDKQIIGVGRNDLYPPTAATKPRFHYHDDPERFIAVKPDLVLIRPMILRGYPNLINRLEKAGITVVSFQPSGIKAMLDYWNLLGRLTDRHEAAQKMIQTFKSRVVELKAKTAHLGTSQRRRVYFEAIHSKMKTFSQESMAIYCLTTAGGVNVANDAKAVRSTNIAAYGKERILAKARQIDVFLAQTGPMNRVDADTIVKESGFMAIKAVREGQIFLVDEKLVSRPTLRLLTGIERIGAILYPDLYLP